MYSQHAELVRRHAPRYAKSMDDLIAPMGLPNDIPTVAALEALAQQSPYFAEERSERWRTFFSSLDPADRLEAATRRRMWMYFSLARFKRTCAYCWLPLPCCMCARVISSCRAVQRAMGDPNWSHCDGADEGTGPAEVGPAEGVGEVAVSQPRPQVKVTFILHAQEVLRMTNSAHVAAMAMNAGLLVWGLPRHDERIAELGRYWETNPPRAGCGLGWPMNDVGGATEEPGSFEGVPIVAASGDSDHHGLSSDEHIAVASALSSPTSKLPSSSSTKRLKRRAESCLAAQRRREGGGGCDGSSTTTAPSLLDADEVADLADMSVLLYPAVDASIPFEQLLAYRLGIRGSSLSSAAVTTSVATLDAPCISSSAPAGPTEPSVSVEEGSDAASVPALHIYLSDGTWSQARVVNKHLSPHMPRVALDISDRYGALFQCLRRRTRESGVSTLEATTIAVSQAIAKDASCGLFSRCDATDRLVFTAEHQEATVREECVTTALDADGSAGHLVPAGALAVEAGLFGAMRVFVNTVAVLSSKEGARGSEDGALSGEEVRALVGGEAAHKVAMQKMREAAQPAPPPLDAVRHLLPAPVTNFCYACDMFVGFELMVRHVTKPRYMQRAAERQPRPFEPTAASKKVWKFQSHCPSVVAGLDAEPAGSSTGV